MQRDDSSGVPGRRYWSRHARNYDRSMLLFGRPVGAMVELVQQEVRGLETVLEVGAGTGIVTVAMAAVARRVVATDYSGEMVNVLREKLARKGLANVACSERDMYALGFETGSFDAVVCANVLHLVPDLPGALAALTNVLRPGGKLVVPTFVHAETLLAHLASRVLAITGFPGRTRLTTTSLRRFVEAAGIEVHRQQVLPGVIPVAFVAGTRPR